MMDSGLGKDGDSENGNHFLALLETETCRLKGLACSAERELEEDEVPEEVGEKLRVAVGKTKMLLRKKFPQFEDLCFKNIGIKSDIRYPVNSEDLAGYWDTITIQLIQVYKIYDEVDTLRKNNWKEPEISPTKPNREKKIGEKITGGKTIRKTKIGTQVT